MRFLVGLAAFAAVAACGDNLQHGPHPLARTTQLVQYGTCSALETDLKSMLIEETWASIDRSQDSGGWGYPEDDVGGDGAPADPTAGGDSGGPRNEGQDYSGTNNQEAGVDEADFVKTDGFHIYTLNGNRLHIFGVPEFGQLTPESVTELEGHPGQMLIDKDANRAVVFSLIDVGSLPEGHPLRDLVGYNEEDGGWWWRNSVISKLTVLDVADRTHPSLVREVYFEGYYQTARKVDSSVRVSSYAMIDRPELWNWWELLEDHSIDETKQIVAQNIGDLELADLVPAVYVRTPDGAFHTTSLTENDCQSYYRPTDSHARGVSSIISFDLLGSTFAYDADHIISNDGVFYSSQDAIVLAENAHSWWWYWYYPEDPDQLNLHVFDIATPGESHYVGSGRVDGWLANQFAIDEQDGEIRVATTTNMWWRWWEDADGDGQADEPPPPESHVFVLTQHAGQPQFDVTGHLDGIASGERLMSARFDGDKAYLVTFRNVDPLFTVDLSDGHHPVLAGHLEVPGFSTYLQPIENNRLLSIGYGGDENGSNWKTTVSLFDVSNFSSPARTSSLAIDLGSDWGYSEALWEHKAFNYWAPKHLLAVPQSSYTNHIENGEYNYSYISQLVLLNVDPTTGLTRKGTIDHTPYYNADPDTWWINTDIRRSIFMGDYLYALSDKAITVHRTSDLNQVATQLLPGYQQGDWWWWW